MVLGERQKFSYLKKYLRGRAEKLTEGLSVTEGNYVVAKELLTNSYGKKDYIVQALYRELEQLTKPLSNAASLRAFMQELEKICRQLEQLGEDLDQKQILVNLESKLPLNVLPEIAKAKNSGGTWTTKELREILKRAVELQETIESMSGVAVESRAAPRGQRQRPQRDESINGEPQPRPSAASAVRSRQSRPPPKCLLCEEQHWASDCQKYGTIEERKERLRELRRCYRCLRNEHTQGECRSTRPCFYCKSFEHHTALCDMGVHKDAKQAGSRHLEGSQAMIAACEEE
ncbi:gag protein [Aphelenchoides avenae]|nr:gag protein [Aphelenchus avenae]